MTLFNRQDLSLFGTEQTQRNLEELSRLTRPLEWVGERLIPFWQWNGQDLTQFAAQQDGTQVVAATWSHTTDAGLEWITAQVQANAGGVANTLSYLPIKVRDDLPVSADYELRAECIVIDSPTDDAVFGIMSRQASGTGIGTGYAYTVRCFAASPEEHDLYRFDAGEVAVQLHHYEVAAAERLTTREGHDLHMGVSALTRLSTNWHHFIKSISAGTYSAKGTFGLLAGCNAGGGGTRTIYFRNIRAYAIPRAFDSTA